MGHAARSLSRAVELSVDIISFQAATLGLDLSSHPPSKHLDGAPADEEAEQHHSESSSSSGFGRATLGRCFLPKTRERPWDNRRDGYEKP